MEGLLKSRHDDVLSAKPETDEARARLIEEIKQRGNSAFKSGSLPECDILYSKALELCEKHFDKDMLKSLLSNRSMVYSKLGKFDKAKADAQKLVKVDDLNPKAFFRLATAQKGLKDFSNALKSFEKVLELDPSNKAAPIEIKAVLVLKEKELEKPKSPIEEKKPELVRKTVTSSPKPSSAPKKVKETEMRGYKVLANGKKTTFFNMERTKEELDLIKQQAESKPQKLVEEKPEETPTDGSVWNKKGTFEEKDLNKWAVQRLKDLLVNQTLELDDIDFKIIELKDLEGDASETFTRGQKRKIFDFSFSIRTQVTTADTEIKADLFIGEFSGDVMRDEELEMELRCAGESRQKLGKSETVVMNFLRKEVWSKAQQALNQWFEEFNNL